MKKGIIFILILLFIVIIRYTLVNNLSFSDSINNMISGNICSENNNNKREDVLIPKHLTGTNTEKFNGSPEGMLFIKGGVFSYHGEDSWYNEPGNKIITVADFYIDKTEVTVAKYREVMGFLPNSTPSWGWRDDHPVVFVSFFDAENYCKKIGKRLPKEYEWEYAAGGPNHYLWSNGNNFYETDYCMSDKKWADKGSTCPICTHGENGYGLCDMSGNVFEWTDSTSKKGEDLKVLRGGGWRETSIGLFRVSFRFKDSPFHDFDEIGFRCCR